MINFAMFTVLKNNIDWAVGEQMMKLVMGNTDLHRKKISVQISILKLFLWKLVPPLGLIKQ